MMRINPMGTDNVEKTANMIRKKKLVEEVSKKACLRKG